MLLMVDDIYLVGVQALTAVLDVLVILGFCVEAVRSFQ